MIGCLVGVLGDRAAADGADCQRVLVLGEGGRDGGVAGDGKSRSDFGTRQSAAPASEGPARVSGGSQRDHITVVIGRLVGILVHRAAADLIDRQGVLVNGSDGYIAKAGIHMMGE